MVFVEDFYLVNLCELANHRKRQEENFCELEDSGILVKCGLVVSSCLYIADRYGSVTWCCLFLSIQGLSEPESLALSLMRFAFRSVTFVTLCVDFSLHEGRGATHATTSAPQLLWIYQCFSPHCRASPDASEASLSAPKLLPPLQK